LGFSIQTFLIGIGAVVGSWLPYIMFNYFGVSSSAPAGMVADNVTYSFYVGAIVFLACILITVIFTKEYSPAEMALYNGQKEETKSEFSEIFKDFANMPKAMKQLGLVQFFSWFALFSMWVFTTPAIAHHVYGLSIDDTSSDQFRDAQLDRNNLWRIQWSKCDLCIDVTENCCHDWQEKNTCFLINCRWNWINQHVFCG
jgi:maltose/moltooligosaccharide transporter